MHFGAKEKARFTDLWHYIGVGAYKCNILAGE